MKSIRIQKKTNLKRLQSGFTSLLFILLVGMALTVATIGYVASIKTMQSSALTTHAQTQAQMQTMVGYQALSEFLKSSNMDLAKISATNTGTVTSTSGSAIRYQKSPNCPTGTGNYCFDIIGESGGAKAILRALFKVTDSVSSSTSTGSIFAGGLVVGGNASFKGATGENIGISTGGANAGIVTDTAGKTVTLTGITVTPFTGNVNVPSAISLRPFANYIFTKDTGGTVPTCYKNNLHSGTSDITTETLITCPSGVSLNNGVWTFNSSVAQLPGIIWLDGNTILMLNKTPNDYVNSVITTGTLETKLPEGNNEGTYDIYATHHYLLTNATNENIKSRLLKVCPADNYPLQYCQTYNATNRNLIISLQYFKDHKLSFIKDTNTYPTSLANILFLTDIGFTLDAANKTTMNLYGNIMGTRAAGGTGGASGKITGTGDINIRGNIVVTGNFTTEMQGNMDVVLGNSDAAGNSIPVTVKSVTPSSISYQ